MKKIIPLSLLTTMLVSLANAQIVNIPDPVFKDFLVNHSWLNNPNNPSGGTWISLDANHDGEIQESEANPYLANFFDHGFDINNLAITDLTGIEAFHSIKTLSINNCPITYLNIDGCVSLNSLKCTGSSLISFNMNHNTLEELEISGSLTLTTISLVGFGLQSLKTNNNPNLTTINLSIHNNLTLFQCYNNAITSLDVSGCTGLEQLYCTGNQLTSLNLANGNIQSFQQIVATGYPNLTCVTVDNITVANYLWGGGYPYEFDSWVSFNTDCTPPGPCLVNIPDTHFKAALLADPSINTNSNTEIECTEAIAYSGAIHVDNLQIADLKGIEAFVNITAFSANNNVVDSLNVSGFNSLASLSCTGNPGLEYVNASECTALSTFNVSSGLFVGVDVNLSGCTALTDLSLSQKNLTALNLDDCTALEDLDCSDNKLTMLSVDGCVLLDSLDCSKNQLTALDVSSNLALIMLNCSDNQISNLSTVGISGLTTLNCNRNQLPYLFVALNAALTTVDCSYNPGITYLDFNNNVNLTTLNCSHCSLNSITVNNNPALTSMDCSYNNLTVLNVNVDVALVSLNCNYNQLTNIDVSNNHNLQFLRCDHNQLPQVDVSSNLALKTLSCAENGLPTIDVSNNLHLQELNCSHNQLSNLDLSSNTEMLYLVCTHNQLTALDVQNNPMMFYLQCTKNQLVNLDLSGIDMYILACDSNELQSLNLANGNNPVALMIAANDNPELECIQVDDANYSTTNWVGGNYVFDAGVSFNEDCGLFVGTGELISNHPVTVYPNPANGIIFFSEQTDVQVSNALGQIVGNRKNVTSLDLSTHPTGIYFLTFTDDKGQILQQNKIVKE